MPWAAPVTLNFSEESCMAAFLPPPPCSGPPATAASQALVRGRAAAVRDAVGVDETRRALRAVPRLAAGEVGEREADVDRTRSTVLDRRVAEAAAVAVGQ